MTENCKCCGEILKRTTNKYSCEEYTVYGCRCKNGHRCNVYELKTGKREYVHEEFEERVRKLND